MKEITGQLLPGYRIYEYLLVLNPHEELRDKIMDIKKDFYDKYRADTARWGKPHITLVNYLQYEMFEERTVNRLRQVAMGFHPIKLELKNYGSFPSHTIYINITSKLPVQSLVKQIRTETQRLMKLNKEYKPHFIMEPHLTVARKLEPWQYEKAWLEYNQKLFTGRFIADGMLLLKREVGEMKYQVMQHFAFQNLPVTIRQGNLFN